MNYEDALKDGKVPIKEIGKFQLINNFCDIAEFFEAEVVELDGSFLFFFKIGGRKLEVQLDPWAETISITSPLENPSYLTRYSFMEGKGKLKALLTYKKLLEKMGEGADDGWKVILQKTWS